MLIKFEGITYHHRLNTILKWIQPDLLKIILKLTLRIMKTRQLSSIFMETTVIGNYNLHNLLC